MGEEVQRALGMMRQRFEAEQRKQVAARASTSTTHLSFALSEVLKGCQALLGVHINSHARTH